MLSCFRTAYNSLGEQNKRERWKMGGLMAKNLLEQVDNTINETMM